MKKFVLTMVILCAGMFVNQINAQVIEDTIKVEGVCDMCKERIEEAAYGKGVKYANWDKVSQSLGIVYKQGKTSLAEIESRIANAGHSTQNVKAKRDDYESLPDCCQYEHLETH